MTLIYFVIAGQGMMADATYTPHLIGWGLPDPAYRVWMVPGTYDDEGHSQ